MSDDVINGIGFFFLSQSVLPTNHTLAQVARTALAILDIFEVALQYAMAVFALMGQKLFYFRPLL